MTKVFLTHSFFIYTKIFNGAKSMYSEFVSVGIISLLSAMSPGPDFACVTKNTLVHARRAGIFTSIGIASAIIIHMIYCVLGIAILISQSPYLFNFIKYLGAAYLIYLGINLVLTKSISNLHLSNPHAVRKMSDFTAFRQGFLCNLLNPKAMMFFLALFTLLIKPATPTSFKIIYALEIILITLLWFITLTILLSHKKVSRYLNRAEFYIIKLLGIFLIAFGVIILFYKK